MTTFDLLLVGHGNVGRRFESLLVEQRTRLAAEGIRARVVGVKTRRGSPQPTIDFIRDECRRHAVAAREGRLVVVETTILDVERGEPATSHVRAALALGAHVVTTNKGPVAFAYDALMRAAARGNRRFLFEGAVMDGVPIFNLARETLPAVTIASFRGIVNTTTNFILTALENGQAFDAALEEMRARGIAEADASLDIDGWDAAAKTAALANVLLGARITPRDVARRGIRPDTAEAAMKARREGRRMKLVARAARHGTRVTARVAPEVLAAGDFLARVDGQQNAIVFDTDLLGEIAVVQRGSGLTQTAYALLSDLITIARTAKTARATPRPRRTGRRDRILSPRARRSR